MGKDPFDLVIKGGTLATAADSFAADLGITDGRIAAIGTGLAGNRSIDATGRYVLPGGIETHAHIAQESSAGLMPATDYTTGSIAAAFGGNTMLIPFAAQQRGQSIADVLKTYDGRAEGASVLDYSYHLICSDPDEATLGEGLPMAFRRGITSFKVFLTYDRLRIDEAQMLDILTVARAHGALTMVHAENHGITQWMTRRLLDRGYVAPRYQPISRPRVAEEEAIHRAVLLARFAEAPLLVVHVSTDAGARIIAAAAGPRARRSGARPAPNICFWPPTGSGRPPGWREENTASRRPCEARRSRRSSGSISAAAACRSTPPTMRRTGSTLRGNWSTARTRPSTAFRPGCRESSAAARCCSRRA